MTDTSFEVDRKDLSITRYIDLADAGSTTLGGNEILVSVDKFALTANNITYGVAGDMIGYWQFFPAQETWGRIPVWGIGTVQRSNVPGLVVGDRYYGYFPMSSYLIVAPVNVSERGFVDGSAHRADLPPVYNNYSKVTADNGFDPAFDNHQMLYRPLFMTAFVLDDFFDDNDFFGAKKIILSSASSKTSFSLAYLLHKNRDVKVTGLTSSGNVKFVKGLGIYDEVVTYEDVSSMNADESVAFADMAGNRKVLENLHHHFQDNMKYSCGVGITHWESRDGQEPSTLPGAKPEMFFAPTQIQKRTKEWGAEKFQAELANAWSGFLGVVDDWVEIKESTGENALLSTYKLVLGSAPPNQGYIVSI